MPETKVKREKLILGAAGKAHEGAVTLDIDPDHNPDVVHDLHQTPWPFEDNEFQEIICHHVLEHLNDLSEIIDELYRICHKDGVIYIEVPHHTSWSANTPEHKLKFNYFAFDTFIKSKSTWRTGEKKFELLKREISFHKAHRRYFLHRLFNAAPEEYERFWAYMFPAENFKIWLRPIK